MFKFKGEGLKNKFSRKKDKRSSKGKRSTIEREKKLVLDLERRNSIDSFKVEPLDSMSAKLNNIETSLRKPFSIKKSNNVIPIEYRDITSRELNMDAANPIKHYEDIINKNENGTSISNNITTPSQPENIFKIFNKDQTNETVVDDIRNIGTADERKLKSTITGSFQSITELTSDGFRDAISTYIDSKVFIKESNKRVLDNMNLLHERISSYANSVTRKTIYSLSESSKVSDLMTANISMANISSSIFESLDVLRDGIGGTAAKIYKGASVPIAFITSTLLKSVVEKMDKKSVLRGMDSKFGSASMDLYNYLGKNSDKVLLGEDNKLFGTKSILGKLGNKYGDLEDLRSMLVENMRFGSIKERIFGSYNLNSEGVETAAKASMHRKMDYDAETHNTVTTVIPGLLSKIYQTVSGKDTYYDYDSGKWLTRKQTNDLIENRAKESSITPLYSITGNFVDDVPDGESISSEAIDGISDTLYELMKNNIENPRTFDHYMHSIRDDAKAVPYLRKSDGSLDPDKVKMFRKNIADNKYSVMSKLLESRFKRSNFFKSKQSVTENQMNMFNDESDTSYSVVNELLIKDAFLNSDSYKDRLTTVDSIIMDIRSILERSLVFNSSDSNSSSQIVDDIIDDSQDKIDSGTSTIEKEINEKPSSQSSTKQSTASKEETMSDSSNGSIVDDIADTKDTLDDLKDNDIINKLKENTHVQKLMGKLSNTKLGSAIKKASDIGKNAKGAFGGVVDKVFKGGKSVAGLSDDAMNIIGKVTGGGDKVSKITGLLKNSKLATGILGKVGGSAIGKVGGKVMAKLGGKLAISSLGKAAAAFVPGGWLLTLATSMPEILKTITNPIESIKHPFKTIGSFFGLSEHPANMEGESTMEGGTGEVAAQSAISALPLAIGALSSTLMAFSPFGIFKFLGKRQTNEILNNDLVQQSLIAPRSFASTLFSMTPLGSLYNLASGVAGGVLGGVGKLFGGIVSKLASKFMGSSSNSSSGSTSSTATTTRVPSTTATATSTASPSSTASTSNTVDLLSIKSSGGSTNSIGSSAAVPNASTNSAPILPTIKVPQASGGTTGTSNTSAINDYGSSLGSIDDNINSIIDNSIVSDPVVSTIIPEASSVVSNSSASPTNSATSSSSTYTSPFEKIKNIINNYHNTIVNNKTESKILDGNTDYSYDYDQYLLMRDLLNLVDTIGDNTFGISTELGNVLDALDKGNEEIKVSKDRRLTMNEILTDISKGNLQLT